MLSGPTSKWAKYYQNIAHGQTHSPTPPAGRRQLLALGERLRAARLRREMSQSALAEKVGVHVQTIRKLESGTPTTDAVCPDALHAR